MSIKSRLDKLEQKINKSHQDINPFPGWTKEELANYAINGIRPEGKPIIHNGRTYQEAIRKFDGWSKEDLIRYAKTGEKRLPMPQIS